MNKKLKKEIADGLIEFGFEKKEFKFAFDLCILNTEQSDQANCSLIEDLKFQFTFVPGLIYTAIPGKCRIVISKK